VVKERKLSVRLVSKLSSFSGSTCRIGVVCCSGIPVTNCQLTLRNIPEERTTQIHYARNIKSRVCLQVVI